VGEGNEAAGLGGTGSGGELDIGVGIEMSEMDGLIVKEVRNKIKENTFKDVNNMYKSLIGLG
jgi:hypothetical protein